MPRFSFPKNVFCTWKYLQKIDHWECTRLVQKWWYWKSCWYQQFTGTLELKSPHDRHSKFNEQYYQVLPKKFRQLSVKYVYGKNDKSASLISLPLFYSEMLACSSTLGGRAPPYFWHRLTAAKTRIQGDGLIKCFYFFWENKTGFFCLLGIGLWRRSSAHQFSKGSASGFGRWRCRVWFWWAGE